MEVEILREPLDPMSAVARRNLMIAAERRFGALKVPHRVEWLSDNGSAYIAADTARALGLTLLFTPVCSPESNGM
jgi:putative transposase